MTAPSKVTKVEAAVLRFSSKELAAARERMAQWQLIVGGATTPDGLDAVAAYDHQQFQTIRSMVIRECLEWLRNLDMGGVAAEMAKDLKP